MEEVKIPKIEWILKDCPFCGGEARLGSSPDESWYWVTCKRCSAATMVKETEQEAVALWEERLEDRDRDVSRVIKTIRQKLKEAKQNECINDPLGYALYNTWKDRERDK